MSFVSSHDHTWPAPSIAVPFTEPLEKRRQHNQRCEQIRSQAQNRQAAWRLLRARLYEQQRAKADAERAKARNSMIGSAQRAEKIRTYRYKENLVIDHRLRSGGGGFSLTEIMAGHLQSLLDALIEHDTAQRLAAL